MSNDYQPACASFCDDKDAQFLIRWRGKQEGPYTAQIIEAKLAANQIGLLHEILNDGQWVTLRYYLAERNGALKARQAAREEQERQAREEADRRAKEREEQRREDQRHSEPAPHEQGRTSVFEAAVLNALKPKYPKWPWICMSISIAFWLLCGGWQNSVREEAQQLAKQIETMQTPEYAKEKFVEGFFRGLFGDSPREVMSDEIKKTEKIKAEAARIESDYRAARTATLFWLVISALFAVVGIWRHFAYRSHLKSLGFAATSANSPSAHPTPNR